MENGLPLTRPVTFPFAVESLEDRRLLSWGPSAALIGQDKAAADFPTITGAGEVVVDIDSGWDASHSELAGKLWTNPNPNGDPGFPNDVHGWNFVTNTNDPTDVYNATTNPYAGHGTQTASLIAASQYTNPGDGLIYQGIAPGVKILPLKVADANNTKAGVAFDQAVGAALNYVVQMVENHPSYHIVAVNLSLEVAVPGDYATYEQSAITTLHSLGIYIAAASGNDGHTTAINYPAAGAGAFAIAGVYGAAGSVYGDAGATQDTVTTAANRDAQVALLAPSVGDSILSINNSYLFAGDGTSYSTPEVTGAAALIKQLNPSWTPDQITSILQQSGTSVYDPGSNLTYKRLNLDTALKLATPTIPGVISGTVYNDRNGDGVKERKETGLAGMTVTLQGLKRGKPTGRARSTTTDANGNYSFSNVAIGTYQVTQTLSRRYILTQPAAGSYVLAVTSGAQLTAENFGNKPAARAAVVRFSTMPIVTMALASKNDADVLM